MTSVNNLQTMAPYFSSVVQYMDVQSFLNLKVSSVFFNRLLTGREGSRLQDLVKGMTLNTKMTIDDVKHMTEEFPNDLRLNVENLPPLAPGDVYLNVHQLRQTFPQNELGRFYVPLEEDQANEPALRLVSCSYASEYYQSPIILGFTAFLMSDLIPILYDGMKIGDLAILDSCILAAAMFLNLLFTTCASLCRGDALYLGDTARYKTKWIVISTMLTGITGVPMIGGLAAAGIAQLVGSRRIATAAAMGSIGTLELALVSVCFKSTRRVYQKSLHFLFTKFQVY